MMVSIAWLRDWTSPDMSTEQIAEALTLAGLEVESISRAGPELDHKAVVGEVVSIQRHPHASRLKLCKVDTGGRKRRDVVCGAPNVFAGMKTALALPGAKLPDLKVARQEIRGVPSDGMLCSAMELGLEESSDGIIQFDPDAPVGQTVTEYLDLEDRVLTFELTPNRGDCLGMTGIARELATLAGTRLHTREIPKVKPATGTGLGVELEAPLGCARYVGRAISDIDMSARSPDWMVERLRRSGMRSINPIVDVTNYVMHELGQPMHAFDLDRIRGGIVVRMARNKEKLKLLDGSNVVLDGDNLVIADHERAIALAGIMGGDNTAISDRTSSLYLEAAFFSPAMILGKARQFGMHTDASHRFERGVDSQLQLRAMERATRLVMDIAGGEPGPITHAMSRPHLPRRKTIRFERREIERLLGIKMPARKSASILNSLGMTVGPMESGWKVRPPSWRFDIEGQHDLVEEVGRCYGYNKVPPRTAATPPSRSRRPENRLSELDIKNKLISRGFHEAITYSFVHPDTQEKLLGRGNAIRLANPISDSMAVMRQSLWPGLLEALNSNVNRQEERVRLFESGHVFHKARNNLNCREDARLGGVVCGTALPRQWGLPPREVDFFDLKGDLEAVFRLSSGAATFEFLPGKHPAMHPGQCAKIQRNRKNIGYVGKLHPAHLKFYDLERDVYLFELDMEPLLETAIPAFSEISRFPSVQRDLAVLVDDGIPVQSVLDLVRNTGGEYLKNLELFDIYRGKNLKKNKKSMAFSLTFQSESSNLTSSDVDVVTEKIVREIETQLGGKLRS